jgi:hypothetical protein
MDFFSDGIWWLFTVLTWISTVIYASTSMSRPGQLLVILVATGFCVTSFVVGGWIAGIVTLVLAWLIGGGAAAIFHGRSI